MLVMQKCFLFAFILFSVHQEALSIKKGYYTIIAPANVHPESDFHVSFTLNDFHKSCWFNISLTSYPERNKIYGLEGIEIKPGTTKLIKLHAPSSNNTLGFLEIIGYRGIITRESELIYFENEKNWAFVQTDKDKYKPGELIKFRVICIDQLTRPAKLNEEISVEIYNRDSLFRTIHDVKFTQGVFRSEFQLSEHANLGVRRIKVLIGNKFLAYKDIQVVRYVLPKFNVKIINKKEVSINDDQIVLEISASYFYGEPVKGNLSITVINIRAPYPKVIPSITRELKIDGQSTIVLDLKNDLLVKPTDVAKVPSDEVYLFNIKAIVTDELSEEQSRNALEIGVYSKPYKIKLLAPSTFHSDEMLNLKVKVLITDLDGNLIENAKTPVEIIVGCSQKKYEEVGYKEQDLFRIEYKHQDGKDFGIIQLSNKNYSECYAYAEYEDCISLRAYLSRKPTPFDMDIQTESPQESKELEVKIKNPEPIAEFSYEIVSKGDIVKSDYVKVSGNATTCVFRFNVTSAMLPKITIFVHLIRNMSFVGHLKDVLIKRALPNLIEITTDNETIPGESVYINVTTNEGSYVGLMGIDRSAFENLEKNKIFNEENVNWELGSVNSLNFYYHTPFYYRTEDIITFSNALPQGYGGGKGRPTEPPKRLRKLFPESWLFMDFEKTPAGGLNILETVPDSLTTWALTGFSIHPENGLTFTKNTTNLRVFQKFFVSMDLPSLVKDGEIIEVPVYINNYMNEDALTNVSIKTGSEDLQILENFEATSSKPKYNISKLISAKKREKIVIFLKPLKIGNYNVTVQAISSLASDAIQKTLNVQPQGIPNAISKLYLVYLPEESGQENDITIDIPENAVRGSERVEVSVVGDMFQPLMRNLEKLARIPYGNGEENMRLIVFNSIVLKYIKVLNYSIPSLEKKIRQNIELGYQNQLSFKHLDGSFGLFDRNIQRNGDIWQTVFSIWGLEQANDFVQVDPEAIKSGLDYLKSKQQENGCLKSKSGLEEDVKFTALGLMAFLMDAHSRAEYSEVIRKGLGFLFEHNDDLEYSSISAMATYALILGKHEKAEDHLKKLTSHTPLMTSKKLVWKNSDKLQSYIETTAGCLINLFDSQEISEQRVLQIVRGLIISKTEESSIMHMIALQAMIEFIEKLSLSQNNLNIIIKDDQDKSKDFQVNAKNSQDLQTFEISQHSRKINIQSKGHGFAVVDVKYNYNLVPEDESSLYAISISTKGTSKCFGILKICSSAVTDSTKNKLKIMEVKLPSGFIFTENDSQEYFSDKETPDKEILSKGIKSIQVGDGRDKVVVYFEFLTNEVCIEMNIHKSNKVYNSKPGWVIVYDAHDEDQKSAKSFSITEF